jgi:hypothetical protein
MRGLDDYGVVVRYRAGEVFFDPSIGYIFTRNSSLTFGRDLLPSPLYFVPVAGVMQNDGQPFLFNNDQGNQTPKVIPRQPSELLQEITNLTPEMLINSAYPIMEPLLYPTDADIRNAHHFSESPFLERFGIDLIAELLRKRERFEREYRKFLFDTDVNSAWRKDEKGGDLLVGAFNSPGFGKWLKRLRAQFDEARDEALLAGREFVPPHILECHNPDTLPISPYARIILTDEVLTILERLAKEGWPRAPQAQREARDESSPDEVDGELEEIEEQTEEIDEDSLNDEVSELEETGVYKLISLALQNQGELIVVANT